MQMQDERVVMTLDAGGTNFLFSAIRGFKEITTPILKKAVTDDLPRCLSVLVEGFQEVKNNLSVEPVAISFAFPGPADYQNGVIGDLPNFPAFRGGVPLAAFLEEHFGIPVFINNDGNLFAYGEALAGTLPQINSELERLQNPKRYHNLVGVTLGTGFGAGVVLNNVLLDGDNGCGGDVWLMRNKKYSDLIAEESVSIRAVRRVYEENAGEAATALTPRDIFEIAEGHRKGSVYAAVKSFQELGEMAAAAIINALHIVDGIIVIGGGLSGAAKYIVPAMLKEMNRSICTFHGDAFAPLQMEVCNLMEEAGRAAFFQNSYQVVRVPGSDREVIYHDRKKTGLAVTSLGTSKAIYYGAYAFALHQLDVRKHPDQ